MLALGRDASSLYIFEYNSLLAVNVPPIVASALTESPVPDDLLSVNVSVIVAALLSSKSLCHTPL